MTNSNWLLLPLLMGLMLVVASGSAPAAPRKVIISTDIGDDIDDAFALAYALWSPELRLDAVITTHNPTIQRAKLAQKLLYIAGRQDVPVIIGKIGRGRIRGQLRWAQDWQLRNPVTDGARGLARRIMHSREKVTLISIGPMTDVGEMLRIEPRVKEHIDEIILMGGSVNLDYGMNKRPCAEYNIDRDIKAAQTVFESGVPIVMAGLDVTIMMRLEEPDLERIRKCDKAIPQALYALFQVWEEHGPVMYDAVAVALAFQPDICKMEPKCVKVTDDGFTRIIPDGKPNARVCLEVDKPRFMRLFMERILEESPNTSTK